MANYKCKMCGGSLDIAVGSSVVECEYCGTKQTVPKEIDENMQGIYNRANTLRIKSEFDKAEKLYEKIIQADSTQAEAYWGLILCKYGIEYVDDPETFKKIPTCHRASYDSIIADDDYKSVLEYADSSQKIVYEEQAKEIDRIQKEILATAQKEECYDVFICYKEKDENGKRTHDSVIANDIYYQLNNEGLKVFYAAITLEGKLGSAYEPIIFAALNSAKVMLAIGTKPEYFNAVWVKNEWSRYLKIIKKDRTKLLIPCYKDMDAYDLPDEFSHLQAQDMSKLGFIQDIIRGIKKITENDKPMVAKDTVVKEATFLNSGINTAPLLKRAFMFLEDGDFKSADEYCEKTLDIDPENAEAYLGKLMAELCICSKDELKNLTTPFDYSNNFKKACRFGNEALRNELKDVIKFINTRNAENNYRKSTSMMTNAKTQDDYLEVAKMLKKYSWYKDSAEIAEKCVVKSEEIRKNNIYNRANSVLQDNNMICFESIGNLRNSIKLFESISTWRDSKQKADKCRVLIDQLIAEDKASRLAEEKRLRRAKRIRKTLKGIFVLICIVFILALVWENYLGDIVKNEIAINLMEQEKYQQAREIFEDIDDMYMADKCKELERTRIEYGKAVDLYNSGKKKEAIDMFVRLNGYKNSYSFVDEYYSDLFGYDVYQSIKSCKKGDTVIFGSYEQDGDKSNGAEKIEWIVLEQSGTTRLLMSKYAIDCKPYDEDYNCQSWGSSSLSEWLNTYFYNSAFNDAEKALLFTIPGNEDLGQIYLLNRAEATKYLNSSKLKCEATKYAIQMGADLACKWYLRDLPSVNSRYVHCVWGNGTITLNSVSMNREDIGVRPVLWINVGEDWTE